MDEQKASMQQQQPTGVTDMPTKRPWQRPDVKMFALDQTEFFPGPGVDGLAGTFFIPPPPPS
jgi:hypothetical protein